MALLPCDVGAIEHHRAGARRYNAHQAFQGRALAGAVASHQRHDFVALDAQRNVEQDMGIPVIAVQAVALEQAHAASAPCKPQRYASCTAVLFLMSSGVPSTSTLPSCSTVTLSASSNSASMS